jgi:hypothetical protein
MQSIDQQAAASQTSGQPLSRNSRIQTPNSSYMRSAARRRMQRTSPPLCDAASGSTQHRTAYTALHAVSQGPFPVCRNFSPAHSQIDQPYTQQTRFRTQQQGSDPHTVVLGCNAPKDYEEHLFGHSELRFAALMLWLGAIRCSSRLPIQRRRLFGAEIKS